MFGRHLDSGWQPLQPYRIKPLWRAYALYTINVYVFQLCATPPAAHFAVHIAYMHA